MIIVKTIGSEEVLIVGNHAFPVANICHIEFSVEMEDDSVRDIVTTFSDETVLSVEEGEELKEYLST